MEKYTKKGMSLVELLVAIAILSLGMAAFTLLATRAWQFKGYAVEQATSTAAASRIITQVIHELRTVRQADDGSYPIKEVLPFSLTVYRDEDGDASSERVRYFVEDDKFKKGVIKFNGSTYDPDDENVEVLLNYITNRDLSEPFFLYYDNNYPISTDHNMSNAAPYDVRLVRIHLWINIKPIVAPENINLESFVEFRNLNES